MPMFHTTPQLEELTPETKAMLDRFAKEHANDPVGGVADVVLYEDDEVRIWEMKLAPGEWSDLPRTRARLHPRDHGRRSRRGVTPETSPSTPSWGSFRPRAIPFASRRAGRNGPGTSATRPITRS